MNCDRNDQFLWGKDTLAYIYSTRVICIFSVIYMYDLGGGGGLFVTFVIITILQYYGEDNIYLAKISVKKKVVLAVMKFFIN